MLSRDEFLYWLHENSMREKGVEKIKTQHCCCCCCRTHRPIDRIGSTHFADWPADKGRGTRRGLTLEATGSEYRDMGQRQCKTQPYITDELVSHKCRVVKPEKCDFVDRINGQGCHLTVQPPYDKEWPASR